MSRLMDPQPKFLPEWRLANQIHYGSAEAERSRSERLTAESKRRIEESGMAAKRMQQDVNKRLGKATSINRDHNRIRSCQSSG
uniref:Uncharacterized protein n=1 Tax=Salmo trutta TaxID=8032 RepID=A0A673X8C5_SALTR